MTTLKKPPEAYAYADDILLHLKGRKAALEARVPAVIQKLKAFEEVTGLHLNLSKSRALLQGYRAPELGGIKVEKSVKWLGIQFGEVSREEAYAKPIIQARRRASIISTLQLTLKEKAVLVQQGLYPILHLTLQAYPPTQEEVTAVKALVAQAMNCTTITQTVDILSQPEEAGGVGLWHPKAYCHWAGSLSAVWWLREPNQFGKEVNDTIKKWAAKVV